MILVNWEEDAKMIVKNFFAERNGKVKCNYCNGHYGSKHE